MSLYNVCIADSIPLPFDAQILTVKDEKEMISILEIALKNNKEALIVPLDDIGEDNDK